MNKDHMMLIKEAFHDDRKIIEKTPEEIRTVPEGIYSGGYVYTTEDGEFIDLEIQERDYDIEDHIKYIEFAEAFYENHHKKIYLYIYCLPTVKINLKLYNMKSNAEFILRLAQVQDVSLKDRLISKLRG